MTNYLPDTNIFIGAAKDHPAEAKFLSQAIKKKQITLSPVVIGEFFTNATPTAAESFKKIIFQFNVLPIDFEVAQLAAKYRKESLKSTRVHLLDCFLAAQAKIHNLTLVTNNKSDFPMKGIKIISPK